MLEGVQITYYVTDSQNKKTGVKSKSEREIGMMRASHSSCMLLLLLLL